jgi:hypothetical protein
MTRDEKVTRALAHSTAHETPIELPVTFEELYGNDVAPTRSYSVATSVTSGGTVRVFRQKFTLEDANGSHACSLEARFKRAGV